MIARVSRALLVAPGSSCRLGRVEGVLDCVHCLASKGGRCVLKVETTRLVVSRFTTRAPPAATETAALADAFNAEMEDLFGAARMTWPTDDDRPQEAIARLSASAEQRSPTWQPRNAHSDSGRESASIPPSVQGDGADAADQFVSGLSDQEIAEMQQEMLRQQLQLQANAAAAEEGDATSSTAAARTEPGIPVEATRSPVSSVDADVTVERSRGSGAAEEVHVHVHLYGDVVPSGHEKAGPQPLHVHVHVHRHR